MAISSSKKRWIFNLILLLLTLGLVGMVYQQLQRDQQGAETLYQSGIGETVEELSITLPGQPSIVIRAENEAGKIWSIVEPIQARANQKSLQQLLTLLGEPVLSEYSAEGKPLAEYGLEAEAIIVRFNTVVYRLGNLNPVNHLRYILLKDRLLLVDEAVYELLSRGVEGFKENG